MSAHLAIFFGFLGDFSVFLSRQMHAHCDFVRLCLKCAELSSVDVQLCTSTLHISALLEINIVMDCFIAYNIVGRSIQVDYHVTKSSFTSTDIFHYFTDTNLPDTSQEY